MVTDDLSFGICVERTEYHYELSTWGFRPSNKYKL
ncbi:YxiF family protein [Marinithermofilum abyssi]